MPITIRSRLHFNRAPFGAFKPHKPPSHIRVVVPLNFNLKPSYCTWTLVFTWRRLIRLLFSLYGPLCLPCLYLSRFLPSLDEFTMYLTTPWLNLHGLTNKGRVRLLGRLEPHLFYFDTSLTQFFCRLQLTHIQLRRLWYRFPLLLAANLWKDGPPSGQRDTAAWTDSAPAASSSSLCWLEWIGLSIQYSRRIYIALYGHFVDPRCWSRAMLAIFICCVTNIPDSWSSRYIRGRSPLTNAITLSGRSSNLEEVTQSGHKDAIGRLIVAQLDWARP